jgi:hypothetical protein
VATKLTQSPWFLKKPKLSQPPFLHCCFVVGKKASSIEWAKLPAYAHVIDELRGAPRLPAAQEIVRARQAVARDA